MPAYNYENMQLLLNEIIVIKTIFKILEGIFGKILNMDSSWLFALLCPFQLVRLQWGGPVPNIQSPTRVHPFVHSGDTQNVSREDLVTRFACHQGPPADTQNVTTLPSGCLIARLVLTEHSLNSVMVHMNN